MATWINELEKNIMTIDDLAAAQVIPAHHKQEIKNIISLHPMSITRYYMSLIDKHNPNDPIRKMIIPSIYEMDQDGSYDTSGELINTVALGLQHKYSNTALFQTTNQCAAYCRYCFRKRSVGYPDDDLKQKLAEAASYVGQHREINNVLISGGDPLTLETEDIEMILNAFYPIRHLSYIRFGSKTPVVFPQRLNDDPSLIELLSRYSNSDKQIYIVTHFNHPNEITAESMAAVRKLKNAGIVINNQTVLMKGVNDRPSIIVELMNLLAQNGINPYYVFQCRPVKRVKKNFQISLLNGIRIIEDAKKQLDGHTKRFKYIMSHITGKIEIIGRLNDDILLKYHQAKNPNQVGQLFTIPADNHIAWYNDASVTEEITLLAR